MSMREYGIRGFGICFDDVSNYFDREKAIKWLAENYDSTILYNKIEDEHERMNSQIMEDILHVQNSVIDFAWADETSYVLIYELLPWQMIYHPDYKILVDEQSAKEYMWENLHEFFDERLTREDFFYKLNIVDDTYLG